MSKYIKLKNNFDFCYPVLENNPIDFKKKFSEINNEKKCMIELRLDYLLFGGIGTNDIIKLINNVCNRTNKKIIATIRTVSEGGKVDLNKERYFYLIKEIYLKTKVNFIDVEYKFYKLDKIYYDSLFKKKKKKIILSMHIFDRIFFENEYNNIFLEMANSSGNYIKFAINMFTKEDLFIFMNSAKNFEKTLKKLKKEAIFIAMGKVGVVSRVWPEYTNTKIVFLTAYGDYNVDLGQLSREIYVKYRKLLAKITKN